MLSSRTNRVLDKISKPVTYGETLAQVTNNESSMMHLLPPELPAEPDSAVRLNVLDYVEAEILDISLG